MYIELIFGKNQCPRLKACAKTNSSKIKSSTNGQNREIEPQFKGN